MVKYLFSHEWKSYRRGKTKPRSFSVNYGLRWQELRENLRCLHGFDGRKASSRTKTVYFKDGRGVSYLRGHLIINQKVRQPLLEKDETQVKLLADQDFVLDKALLVLYRHPNPDFYEPPIIINAGPNDPIIYY